MAVSGLAKPDFRPISEFRRRHLQAPSGLFVPVLRLCREAGMVKLWQVASDGTKVTANASEHKAMRYGRMKVAAVNLRGRLRGALGDNHRPSAGLGVRDQALHPAPELAWQGDRPHALALTGADALPG